MKFAELFPARKNNERIQTSEDWLLSFEYRHKTIFLIAAV
jgi:hypothetical protein